MAEAPPPADVAGSDKLTNTEAVALLQEMGNYERHFNQLQSTYRGFASAWLLAAFGAMGFILTQSGSPKLPAHMLVGAVALAACIGIVLLWIMDVLVYHRLLEKCFDSAEELENKHPVPASRKRMREALGKGKVAWIITFYYGVPGAILALIFLASLYWHCR